MTRSDVMAAIAAEGRWCRPGDVLARLDVSLERRPRDMVVALLDRLVVEGRAVRCQFRDSPPLWAIDDRSRR